MSPVDVLSMGDSSIVELLVNLEPPSEAAQVWLAKVVSDPVLVAGVNELRRRYVAQVELPTVSVTSSGRMPHASSVLIDGDRWRMFFFRRRMTLSEVGPMLGRSREWASVMANRGRTSYYAIDDLAVALGLTVEQIIEEVGTDEERRRMTVCC